MQFTTLAMAPDNRGRNFQICRMAQAPGLPWREIGAHVGDIPLSLVNFAKSGEVDCVAAIPLPEDCQIILRVRSQGETNLGYRVFANAIIVTPDDVAALGVPPVNLLNFIPVPGDDDDFGGRTLVIDTPPEPPASDYDWTGLSCSFYPRLIVTQQADTSEQVLASILNDTDNQTDDGWKRGWATTASLGSSGAFLPEAAFDLLVLTAEQRAPQGGIYVHARMAGEGIRVSDRLSPPDNWQARKELLKILKLRHEWYNQRDGLPAYDPGSTVDLSDQIHAAVKAIHAPLTLASRTMLAVALARADIARPDVFALAARSTFRAALDLAQSPSDIAYVMDAYDESGSDTQKRLWGFAKAYVLPNTKIISLIDLQILDRLLSDRHNLLSFITSGEDLTALLDDLPDVTAVQLCQKLLIAADRADFADEVSNYIDRAIQNVFGGTRPNPDISATNDERALRNELLRYLVIDRELSKNPVRYLKELDAMARNGALVGRHAWAAAS